MVKVKQNSVKTPKKLKIYKDTVTNNDKSTSQKSKTIKKAKKTGDEKKIVKNLKSVNKLESLKIPKVEKKKKSKKASTLVVPDVEVDFSEYESKYNIKADNVEKAVTGVLKFVKENPKLQNQLLRDQIPLFLQINCFKIAKGHSKVLRIPLKHSLLTPDDEICFIVKDVKGIKNKEHDKHLEYYEELFDKKGVKNIKKIMTFHEFRTEYETFELKNRLVDLYDYFLVDAKVSGKVVHKCGKLFYKKRKVPNPIKLQVTKLKEHIENSLLKTQFNYTGHGDSYMVQFGHSEMETVQLVENVFSLIEGLDKVFPGGFNNIMNLNIFTHRATSIPIYLSLKNPSNIAVPVLKSKPAKGLKTVKDELSTVTNADVLVKPDGTVKVLKQKGVEKSSPDETGIEDLVRVINNMNDNKRKRKEKRVRGTKKKVSQAILLEEETDTKEEQAVEETKENKKVKAKESKQEKTKENKKVKAKENKQEKTKEIVKEKAKEKKQEKTKEIVKEKTKEIKTEKKVKTKDGKIKKQKAVLKQKKASKKVKNSS